MNRVLLCLLAVFGTIFSPLSADIKGGSWLDKRAMSQIWDRLPTAGTDLIIEVQKGLVAYAIMQQGRPEVHISTGMMKALEPYELRFVISHEVAHTLYNHMDRAAARMDMMHRTPGTLSGMTFLALGMKFDEQQADTLGQTLYKAAGWPMDVFARMQKKCADGTLATKACMPSLSLRDPHFAFPDRFKLLVDRAGGLK